MAARRVKVVGDDRALRDHVSPRFAKDALAEQKRHAEAVAARMARRRALYGPDPDLYLEHLLDTANDDQLHDEHATWLRTFLVASCGRHPGPALVRDLNGRLRTHRVIIQLPPEFPGRARRPRDRFPFRLSMPDEGLVYAEMMTFLYEREYKRLRRCARCKDFLLDVRGRRRGNQAFCSLQCKNAAHNPRRDPGGRREDARSSRKARRVRRVAQRRVTDERGMIARGADPETARQAAIANHPLR